MDDIRQLLERIGPPYISDDVQLTAALRALTDADRAALRPYVHQPITARAWQSIAAIINRAVTRYYAGVR